MKGLRYVVDTDVIDLQENKRDEDIEFIIIIKKQEVKNALHQIRQFFESDEIYTDILFYTYQNHIQIIVKKDSYLTFVLGLFKWKLLKKIEWIEN
ncbi:hypothetical protein [Bacillus massilinigeriensis]|uniref:hypothetical protein n=1 Tax=Bacillus massilionigeriensis TaxID=1805475 RepID=UPI00096B034F|nr:hypothetical protein [Bacillus massilionigeriensis]